MSQVLVGLPKSANVYIRLAIAKTLGEHALNPDLPLDEMDAIFTHPVAHTDRHLWASEKNFDLFRAARVSRVAVLVREPKDAIVSWWHHMERDDVRANGLALAALVKDRLAPADYYERSSERKLNFLIQTLMPHFQDWLLEWSQAKPENIAIEFFRYEDFTKDKAATVQSILQFFGFSEEVVMPPEKPERVEGIDHITHFRRGLVGSHVTDMTTEQMNAADRLVDPRLYKRFGWHVPSEAIMRPQTLVKRYRYQGVPIEINCTDSDEGTGRWSVSIKGDTIESQLSFATSIPELLHDAMLFIEEEFGGGKLNDFARERVSKELRATLTGAH